MDSSTILFFIVILGAAVVFGLFERVMKPQRKRRPRRGWQNGAGYGEAYKAYEAEGFPYRAKNGLMTATELEFFQVLRETVGTRATVCPMVRLGDIVEVDTHQTRYEQSHDNRINRKHIDFVLCDPVTMKPRVGVELDDRSHQRADRRERDAFVDAVFAAAALPLVHIPASRQYTHDAVAASLAPYFPPSQTSPRPVAPPPAATQAKPALTASALRCPRCGGDLVMRTAQKGEHAGKQFWGCSRYPECRYYKPLGDKAQAQK